MRKPRNLGPLGRAMARRLPPEAREKLLGSQPWRRRSRLRGSIAIGTYAIAMLGVVFGLEPAPPEGAGTIWILAPGIVLLAFIFQTMDASSGMGFGTALSPLLLATGYDLLDVVPSLLIAQALTGLLAGWLYAELEIVRFSPTRPLGRSTLALVIVAIAGLVGTVATILLAYVALDLSNETIETYIGLLVIAMGLSALLRHRETAPRAFSRGRLIAFALFAGANKGVSGGGYGPVMTLGAIHSGLSAKPAVAITVLAEGFSPVVGVCMFVLLMGRLDINFSLVPSILTGSFIAALAAPFLVNFVPTRIFRALVPAYALVIGCVVLLRLYVF